ncbi:hypothetical protein FBEOM_715 [Fusarium beomiforme]|uniref:Uncharacterized protein n=1 Tax=Fusarium beomiforme TaxID=44412 RepID=A0A9P5E1Q9_9HYPO|nr:hypothetical protein FBEOM_715 [Fusarium beomiforme]
MTPLRDKDRPHPTDPNGGNSDPHVRPDEEPQSFLTNLDMSEFQDFDFDFSSVEETSHSIEAYVPMTDAFEPMVPLTDQSTYDFSIVPTLDDSDQPEPANFDDDWLSQFVELGNPLPSALEFVNSSLGPHLPDPPLQIQEDRSQQQAIQRDGNLLQHHLI